MRDDAAVNRELRVWCAVLVVAASACGFRTSTSEASPTTQPQLAASGPGPIPVHPNRAGRTPVTACERFDPTAARLAAGVGQSALVTVLSNLPDQCQVRVGPETPHIVTLMAGEEVTEADWVAKYPDSRRADFRGLMAFEFHEAGQDAMAVMGPGFTMEIVGAVDAAHGRAALDQILGP